jgi:hypothetical protein
VGAGAGAVALDPASVVASPGHGPCAHASSAASADHFGRIFRLPPFAPQSPRVAAALRELGRPGGLLDAADPLAAGPKALIVDLSLSANNPNNPNQTAGTTFFGQFLDHDVTFDATSRLARATNPAAPGDLRTPALDLDSVFGAGPVAQQELYDPADHIKLKVESGGVFEDLPRRADGAAIIGDPAQRRAHDHLQAPLRLPALPQPVSATFARGPTGPAPTAKQRDSSAPCWPAGPTDRSTPQATNARQPLTAGSGPTTIAAPTAPSATSRPSLASTS